MKIDTMRTLTRRKRILNKAMSPNAAFPAAIALYVILFLSMLVGMHHIQLNHDVALASKGLDNTAAYLRNRTRTTSEISNFVHERSRLDAPPVYMAIPTVRRQKDKDYLLLVLQSLENAHFPLEHVHVFYNGNPQQQSHLRWEQSETLYSSKGVHFLWNDAPVPEPHPAAYDRTVPLPPQINATQFDIQMALEDTKSRKDWRRKECHDFCVIMRHMLDTVVYHGVNLDDPVDVAKRDHSWIIFNQDDAQWNLEFFYIYDKLNTAGEKVTRWDISRQGLVCVALRADFLFLILEKAQFWCDFIPVDWMVWSYEDENHTTNRPPVEDNWIKHIGKVSSRIGLVAEVKKNKNGKNPTSVVKDGVHSTAGNNNKKAPLKVESIIEKGTVLVLNNTTSEHHQRNGHDVDDQRKAEIRQQQHLAQHNPDPVVHRSAADQAQFDKNAEEQIRKQKEFAERMAKSRAHVKAQHHPEEKVRR